MPDDHGVRVEETAPGYCHVTLNGGMVACWIGRDKADGVADSIRKAIEAARTKALDEAIAECAKQAQPMHYPTVKMKLEQLKERDDGQE